MADLNKLLVKVPANLCDAFRTKYLTGDGSTPRDTSYDKKIVFLEDTKDIFSQGKIYGTSHAEFEELKNKIEDKSVTLTFGVSSFDSIREEGGPGSDAETHYDAVYKAYTNNGIVKIALNNGNSAILSNIEFENGITAMGDDRYTIKGTLCPNSLNGIVGNNKSYNITFRYDSGDPAYGIGYYVSCKEIKDTLYNKTVGGTEIEGDASGDFMPMIEPGTDTLKTVLKQLLTNDLLLNNNRCIDINLTTSDTSTFEFNVTGTEAETYFNAVQNAYKNGSNIKINLVNSVTGLVNNSAIISNLEKTNRYVNLLVSGDITAPGMNHPEVYVGILCPYKVGDSADHQSYTITFYKDTNSNSYHAQCVAIASFGSAAYEDKSYFDKAGAATIAQNNSYAYAYSKFEESKVYAEDKMMFVLGRADAEETSNTVIGTRKYANSLANTAYSNAKNYTDSILPTVSPGNNISVVPSTDSNGKINYKVSTTASVFNYKGNKTTIEELQAVQDSYSGDVWSVGAANAPSSSLYAWDGDEWINIGPADGLKSTSDTASHGVQLSNNSGEVNITVTPGSIADGNDSVVTGGTVYSFVNEFKTSLGSAAYKDETYFDKAGTAASAVEDLENRLPTWDSGRGINIGRPDPYHGIFTYTVSTTNEILRYLGDYTNSTPSFDDNNIAIGDAYSKDGFLYSCTTYEGHKAWKPIVGNMLFNSVSTTYVQGGIRLDLNSSQLGLVTKHGEIGSPVDSYSSCWNFVTGTTVHSYISSLRDSKTSTDGSHVNVTVSTKGGNVSSVSVTESDNLKTAVDNANSALQSVNVLGKTLDKTTNAITVDEAKTYLGLGSAAYKDETYFDKAGAATAVENKLPGVTNGTGIEVSSSSDAKGKVTYTLSTTSEVIRYKGNVEKVNELGSGTEGDVYSVKNSLLYRYNGGGWSKIAGNIQEIDPTSRNGIALILNDDNSQGELSLSVTTGKVSSSKYGDGNQLVKGYDVYEALCAYTIKDVIVNAEDSTYITVAKNKYSDSSYSYCEISLNEAAIYSYVLDNIWEEFSLA